MFSKEPEEPNYNDGDEEDDDDEEEGELVVVGSEVGALVKQEVWGGDDSIPRQAAHLKPILDGTGSAVPVPTVPDLISFTVYRTYYLLLKYFTAKPSLKRDVTGFVSTNFEVSYGRYRYRTCSS